MLTDIIARLLATEHDIDLLGEVGTGANLPDEVARLRPDLVILGLHDADLAAVSDELLKRTPALRVIGVQAEGRRTVLYELRPHQVPLGELSAEGFVDAIRASTAGTKPNQSRGGA